jgi:hypothetical protein
MSNLDRLVKLLELRRGFDDAAHEARDVASPDHPASRGGGSANPGTAAGTYPDGNGHSALAMGAEEGWFHLLSAAVKMSSQPSTNTITMALDGPKVLLSQSGP